MITLLLSLVYSRTKTIVEEERKEECGEVTANCDTYYEEVLQNNYWEFSQTTKRSPPPTAEKN